MAKKSKSEPEPREKTEHAKDLQKAADEAAAKGFYGDKVDPTPNEHYSLETPPDAPTPETDEDAAVRLSAGGHDRVAVPGAGVRSNGDDHPSRSRTRPGRTSRRTRRRRRRTSVTALTFDNTQMTGGGTDLFYFLANGCAVTSTTGSTFQQREQQGFMLEMDQTDIQ
jgi:hypothetical protein